MICRLEFLIPIVIIHVDDNEAVLCYAYEHVR